MPAGRPPKPTALKVIAGNPGKRALNKSEPAPEVIDDLTPPAYLPEQAREVWAELAPILAKNGLLTEADTAMLGMGCVAIANYRAATKLAPPERQLIKGAKGQITVNPAAITQSMAFKQAMTVLRDFGLSPTARTGVTAGTGGEAGNPFARNGKRTAA